MKSKKVLFLTVLITVVFAIMTMLNVKSSSRKITANRNTQCDITAHIDKPEGITLFKTEDAELVIPDKTEIHITFIRLDGYVGVDRADIEISDEIREHYSEHPLYPLAEATESDLEDLLFLRRINVEDIDSEEVMKIYNKMQDKHDNYDTNITVVAAISSLLYLCPVTLYTVRKIKKGRYGVGLALVPLLFLFIGLAAFELLFRLFVG